MKNWTEAFKEKLSEDRSTLPDDELEVLEGLIRRRRQKRALSWAGVAFAAAASVSLVIGFAHRETDQTINLESVQSSNKYLVETIGEVAVPSEEPYPVASPPSLKKKPTAVVVPYQSVPQEERDSEIVDTDPYTQIAATEKHSDEVSEDKRPDVIQPSGFYPDPFLECQKADRRHPSKRFEISLSAGGSTYSNLYYDIVNYLSYDAGGGPSGSPIAPDKEAGSLPYDPFLVTTTYDYHHKPQIITYGLSLRYRLSDRFDLSSGLCYYGTSSDVVRNVRYLDNWAQVFLKQDVSYIGVPLHLDWYPLKGDRFSVYAGAGGEVRKRVYAKRGDERLKDNNVYLSAIALAGLRYEPIKHVGLFVEPQYSHSFLPENPSVRSFLTETPDLFTVKVGLSIGL